MFFIGALPINQVLFWGSTLTSLAISVPAGYFYSEYPATLRDQFEGENLRVLKDGDPMNEWVKVLTLKNEIAKEIKGFSIKGESDFNKTENYNDIFLLKIWCRENLSRSPLFVWEEERTKIAQFCTISKTSS